MNFHKLPALIAIVFCCSLAIAKEKEKAVLPVDVLQARTVLVIVDPTAGVDAADPNANRRARVDVEQALDKWGRFRRVQDAITADLVIMVRKGNGKAVQTTISGTPVNGTTPVDVGSTSSPTEANTHVAIRSGNSGPNDPSNAGNHPSAPHPQAEVGPSQDFFAVYRGTKDGPGSPMGGPDSSPIDAAAVWSYSGKNALASPSVEAVEAFRKLVTESEKQLGSHP